MSGNTNRARPGMSLSAEQVPPTERTPCPLCSSSAASKSNYAQLPFRVVRCTSCMLWYLNPRVRADAASSYYQSDEYFKGGNTGYKDYQEQERSLRAGFRTLLTDFEKRGLAGGRLLEVGCGYGYFLDEARQYFSDRVAVELSPAAARSAATLAQASVYSSIDAVPEEERFDFVFGSHVIEHIYDPVSFTRRLLASLNPGGTIVYSTPNMNSLWRKLMGKRWPSFKFPEHVSFFDSDTLSRLLISAGAVNPQNVPITDSFPAREVLLKLGLPAPRFSARIDVPLPATSVCVMARTPQ